MDELKPKDRAEAIALFRSGIIGTLAHRALEHGELEEELKKLSLLKYRTPGGRISRTYSVPTLQRWYYAHKHGGVEALLPKPRSDRGRGRDLTEEQRELLLDIRKENPGASTPLIISTLETLGLLDEGEVQQATLNRLYREHGLDRVTLRKEKGGHIRLRWQAEHPGALWHGDVCHASPIVTGGTKQPVRIHATMDDASRYVVAIEAMHTEREVDMLSLLVRAVRKHGPPEALYLDNGSTYRGDTLAVACARMGTTLLHAKPYDAPARGKMERFWRTLREGCVDYLGSVASLHDINVRLWAFLDEHYHRAPHAGLMGRCPQEIFSAAPARGEDFDEKRLRDALTVRMRRRVRGDSTVPVDGTDWEVDQGFLAGHLVTVARCLVEPDEPPWIEHEGKRLVLHPVDPIRNARRERSKRCLDEPHPARTPFDPPKALLDKAVGRSGRRKPEGDQ